MILPNLSIGTKLGMIITAIVLVSISLSVLVVSHRLTTFREMDVVMKEAELTACIGNCVHDLQIERGASSIYIGSKGAQFKQELGARRIQTDATAAALRAAIAIGERSHSESEEEYRRLLSVAMDALDQLPSVRKRISDLDFTTDQSIFYFSSTIIDFLAVIPGISRSTSQAGISTAIFAYSTYQEGKERAGEERAIICAALAQDHLDQVQRTHLVTVIAQQEAYLAMNRSLEPVSVRAAMDQTVSGPDVEEVARIRGVVLANTTGDHFGEDSKHWFTVISHKLDLMKLVTDRAGDRLVAMVGGIGKEARSEAVLFISLGILSCVCAAFALIITFSIVGAAKRLAAQAMRIGAGDLRDISQVAQGRDEIGQLSQVMVGMADSLRKQIQQKRSTVENLATATAQILASTQEQAASAQQHAASVQETSTTMEEVRQTGQQVAERSRQVASSAEATSTAGVTGRQAVADMAKTMDGIRSQIESVAERIVSLSEKTQAIGEIIAAVNDMAERANILALNAGIEAASAGEHGARFAVVAHELKGLADQAKDGTIQIRTILSDIQKGINSSVMLAEDAVKISDSGRHRSQSAQEAIRQFVDTTEGSVQAFQQIVAATNQQFIGFDQITQALRDMRMSSQQATASVKGLEQAARSLNDLGQKLREQDVQYVL